jgi:hypothetical protein
VDPFDLFCAGFPLESANKATQAIGFLWFHLRSNNASEADLGAISALFERASLPKPNPTRLREAFASSRDVHRGSKKGAYKLSRSAFDRLESEHGHIFAAEPEVEVVVKADVRSTPFLTPAEVDDAFKMAQLYVVLHCYENSVRRLIERVLSAKLGATWWDAAASSGMRTKYTNRKMAEARNKWLSPRGGSPLYYVDWGDLVTLIRKYETAFTPQIHDIKFVELRLEELERVRNIVAHHGSLSAEEDFQRVIISFRDWTLQVQ